MVHRAVHCRTPTVHRGPPTYSLRTPTVDHRRTPSVHCRTPTVDHRRTTLRTPLYLRGPPTYYPPYTVWYTVAVHPWYTVGTGTGTLVLAIIDPFVVSSAGLRLVLSGDSRLAQGHHRLSCRPTAPPPQPQTPPTDGSVGGCQPSVGHCWVPPWSLLRSSRGSLLRSIRGSCLLWYLRGSLLWYLRGCLGRWYSLAIPWIPGRLVHSGVKAQ